MSPELRAFGKNLLSADSAARKLDVIFDTMDDWFLAGRFELADEFLERVPPKFLSAIHRETLICGVLTITLRPWKEGKLQYRDKWAEAARESLNGSMGPSEANKLLRGLV